MGAHVVDAETMQVGGEARLGLEARGGEGRCGQTGGAGAEGTREISERQLDGRLGARLARSGGEVVTTRWEMQVKKEGVSLEGLSCREKQGAGKGLDRYIGSLCDQIGGRLWDREWTLGCVLISVHFEICQEGEPRVDRELRPTDSHDAASRLPSSHMSPCRACLQATSKSFLPSRGTTTLPT